MAIRQTVHDLRHALANLKAEKAARMAAVAAEYDARIRGLEAALAPFDGYDPLMTEADLRPHTELSISDDRLDFIRDYVQERGEVRQADVTEAVAARFSISLNSASGSVSTGMKRLMQEGIIAPCAKRNGSNCWSLIRTLA